MKTTNREFVSRSYRVATKRLAKSPTYVRADKRFLTASKSAEAKWQKLADASDRRSIHIEKMEAGWYIIERRVRGVLRASVGICRERDEHRWFWGVWAGPVGKDKLTKKFVRYRDALAWTMERISRIRNVRGNG